MKKMLHGQGFILGSEKKKSSPLIIEHAIELSGGILTLQIGCCKFIKSSNTSNSMQEKGFLPSKGPLRALRGDIVISCTRGKKSWHAENAGSLSTRNQLVKERKNKQCKVNEMLTRCMQFKRSRG